MNEIATVVALRGSAFVVGLDGRTRPLKVGDKILKGERVVTGADGQVELAVEGGQPMNVGPTQTVQIDESLSPATRPEPQQASTASGTVDSVIQALEQGGDLNQQLEATAAGAGGGGGEGGGSSFVRLLRVSEGVDPLSYQFATARPDLTPVPESDAVPAPTGTELPPDTTVVIIDRDEQGPGVGLKSLVVKEDSANTYYEGEGEWEGPGIPVSVTANAGEGTTLSSIVLSGFAPGVLAMINTSGLGVDPSQLVFDFANNTLTIMGLSGTSFSGIIELYTIPDSDADLGTITAVSTAIGNSSGTAYNSAPSSVTVVVDAVADDVSLSITVNDGEDANGSFQEGETGTVHVTATFGDVYDGSETHTVVVNIPAGFSVSGLPENAVYDGETGTVTFTVTGQYYFESSFSITNDSAGEGNFEVTGQAKAVDNETDTETDESDNEQTANASDGLTVVLPPEPEVTLQPVRTEGDTLWLKEDGEAGAVSVSASTAEGSSLTQIVITGLAAGFAYDFSGLTGTVNFDAGTGTLTITDLSGTSYSGTFTIRPTVEDSDADLGTLQATVTAASDADSDVTGTGDGQINVYVDAVVDAVTLDISVVDSEGDENTTFQPDETGTVTVKATFGDVNDGSETHTVVVTLPAGFSASGLPDGATYDADAGTVTFAVSGQTDFEATFSLTNDSADVGDALVTGEAKAVDNETDQEDDQTDNETTATDEAPLTVADAPTPEVSLTSVDVEDDTLWLKEDGEAKTLTVQASTNTGSSLTSIVIEGLDAGFDYDFSGLAALGLTVTHDAGAGTVTITGDLGTSYTGTFTVKPGTADSDADLGELKVTASAESNDDSSLTNTATDTLIVNVDAVLDEYGNVGVADATITADESTSGALTVDLGLTFSRDSAGFLGSMGGGAGADGDGSETLSVYVTLSDGELVKGPGTPGSATLTYDAGNSRWVVSANAADMAATVAALQVQVPEGYDGQITGSISSAADDAPSDLENDTTDNSKGDSAGFTVTIEGGAGDPSVSARLLGADTLKEDVQSTLQITASTSDNTDELTTLEITGLSTWGVDIAELLADYPADIATAAFNAGVLVITLKPGVESVTLDLLITPPEDSDADGSIVVTAKAQDKTDTTKTSSADTGSVTLVVDAVLDNKADVSASPLSAVNESASSQNVLLGLSLAMVGSGFTHANAGGTDTDGSESVTVTVTVSAGTLSLAAGAPAGAELTLSEGVYTLTAENLADLAAAVAKIQVTVPANYDGPITGTITATTQEANTPAGGNASEPIITDNTASDSANFSLMITDGTPSTPNNLSITLEEESIPMPGGVIGNNEDDGLSYKVENASLIGATNFGVDGFGSIVSVTVSGVTYTPNGSGIIDITDPANGAWRLIVDAEAGTYSFEMLKASTHSSGGGENNLPLPTFSVVAQDGDGSQTGSFTLQVTVVDDVPVIGLAPHAVIEATQGSTVVGQTGFDAGADQAGAKIVFSPTPSSVDASGFITSTYVQGGVTKSGFLTFDGQKLKYTLMDDGSLVAKTADGVTAVYTLTANPATGEYTLTMHVDLDELQVFAAFNVADIKGGNGDFYLVAGTSSGNTVGVDMKATAYNGNNNASESVNTRANFFGVSQQQNIANASGPNGDNDVLVLEFGKAGSWATSTGTQTGTYERSEVSSITFTTAAFGSGETLHWRATLMDGSVVTGQISGSGNANSASNEVNYSITATQTGGAFYKIEFYAGEGSSYDLGNINVNVADGTVDQTTSVNLQGQDGDLDTTASQTINLTFSSDGHLTGGAGSDVLAGSSGDNTLTGGGGSDVFQWSLSDQGTEGDPARDVIKDFSKTEGDVIDLRDLVSDTSVLTFSEVSGKAVLSISNGGTALPEQTIVFDNKNLATLAAEFGAALDGSDLVTKMKDANNLLT